MEKTRQGLQSIGRMLLAQAIELINPVTNNALPPNLTIDPPSQSFILKSRGHTVRVSASRNWGFSPIQLGVSRSYGRDGRSLLSQAHYTHPPQPTSSRRYAQRSLLDRNTKR